MVSTLSLAVTRREIRDTVLDWRVVVPTITLAVLFPAIMVLGIKWGVPFMNRIDPIAATEKAAFFGAMMSAFFPTSFSLVIALESFVGEKERNTIEALLATPISDAQLFLGKFLAVLVPPVVLSLFGLSIYLLGAWIVLGLTVPLSFLVLIVFLSIAEALAMVAGAVVVSSQVATVKAANLLASFIVIPVALAVQGEVLLILFGLGHILWFVLAAFIAIAATLVRMGVSAFNREEILTRENDDLNLAALWRAIRRYWRTTPRRAYMLADGSDEPFSLKRLYFTDIPQIVALCRTPIAVVTGVLVTSIAIGYIFALLHPLRLGDFEVSAILEHREAIALGISLTPQAIFFHNIKTVLLAVMLSVFSFGVAGLIVIVASFGIVGFLMGEASLVGVPPIPFLTAFILPHGMLEVPAAIFIGALNLKAGMALLAPPKDATYGASLLLALVNWGKGAALFVPILFVAAVVEAKITPQIAIRILGSI